MIGCHAEAISDDLVVDRDELEDTRWFEREELASMLARAVNGSVSFFPTLGGGFMLVGLHRTMAWLARKSHRFGNLVKGRCDLLIQDGRVVEGAMRQNNLSEHDLLEDLRLNGNVDDPQTVRAAFVERNGQISVVK